MNVLTRLFCASISASLALSTPARADYVLYLAGMPLTCANYAGTPVYFSFDTSLSDVGMAFTGTTPPRVVFNPIVMSNYSPLMQLFWWGHECGHHNVGGNESAADCFAIKSMRNHGMSPSGLNELQAQVVALAGDGSGHLPGPLRANHFASCYHSL